MGEKRSEEIHKAIARKMEREDREAFFEWLDQNEPDFDDPSKVGPDSERADWEHMWRDTPYDSYEDARQNVSHIGDPDRDYEFVTEPDEDAPMSGESTRQRGEDVDDWGEPDSLY